MILSQLVFGSGLNLWQGNSPSDFLDLQLGIGPGYEYDYVNFEEKRNLLAPTLGIILLGRNLYLGKAKVNQTFAILPPLNNFNNYIIASDTKLSIPLARRWSLSNHVFLRYRNEIIFEGNPKLEFFFTSGLEYEF